MKQNTTSLKKKPWAKPQIYLIDTAEVKIKSFVHYKEGAPVGNGKYILYKNSGTAIAQLYDKDTWDDFHS